MLPEGGEEAIARREATAEILPPIAVMIAMPTATAILPVPVAGTFLPAGAALKRLAALRAALDTGLRVVRAALRTALLAALLRTTLLALLALLAALLATFLAARLGTLIATLLVLDAILLSGRALRTVLRFGRRTRQDQRSRASQKQVSRCHWIDPQRILSWISLYPARETRM